MNSKKKCQSTLILAALITCLLFGGSMILLNTLNSFNYSETRTDVENTPTNGNLLTAGDFNDAPIHVYHGNFSEEWGGSGSVGDPYSISDLKINASYNDFGIKIEHTDDHFKIENITVICTYSTDFGAFHLNNVTNGNITKNIATENGLGFRLEDCENNTLAGNYAGGNAGGFMLTNSANNNTLKNNIADNNNDFLEIEEGVGFIIENSNDNILNNNTATNHGNWGFSFSESENNEITDNTATNNDNGIIFAESNKNNLSKNTVNENIEGITLGDSINNTITENTVNKNDGDGILLGNSSYNTITENKVNENMGYGIYLRVYSNYNTITGNTLKYNEDGCIEEELSEGNEIDNNICENKEEDGEDGENGLEISSYNILMILSLSVIIPMILLMTRKRIAKY